MAIIRKFTVARAGPPFPEKSPPARVRPGSTRATTAPPLRALKRHDRNRMPSSLIGGKQRKLGQRPGYSNNRQKQRGGRTPVRLANHESGERKGEQRRGGDSDRIVQKRRHHGLVAEVINVPDRDQPKVIRGARRNGRRPTRLSKAASVPTPSPAARGCGGASLLSTGGAERSLLPKWRLSLPQAGGRSSG